MTGERGLDGDFCSFKVSYFTDEDDVGILPQKSAQGRGKIQSDLLLHLHLVYAAKLEFDWILGGHDVGIGLVEL